MPATYRIPSRTELATHLEHLVGRSVSVVEGRRVDLERAVFVVYVDDDGRPATVCACDVDLACYAGAALSMIPGSVARESVLALTVPENLRENFAEVANILAGVFNGAGLPHVRLAGVWTRRSELPEGVVDVAETGEGPDLEVSIEGYGTGHVSIRSARR